MINIKYIYIYVNELKINVINGEFGIYSFMTKLPIS